MEYYSRYKWMDPRVSFLDISSDPDEPSFDESPNGDIKQKSETWFLELQEANNICTAAYREFLTLAMQAKTWVEGIPPLSSIEDLQQMFKTPPSPGMRVECSVESAILPVAPRVLTATMMDVNNWASSFSHIVHQASEHKPTGAVSLLGTPGSDLEGNCIVNLKMINAEFKLPTPLVPNRKFSFLRFQRQVIPKIWAIIDVSTDYFQQDSVDSTLYVNCRRRPSGVIVRQRDDACEVIWIENVEVPECRVEDNMYSEIINSNLVFCAKRWVSTFLWKCKRNEIILVDHKLPQNAQAYFSRTPLLELTSRLKKAYLECISEAHNENKWNLLSDQGVKILEGASSEGNSYMAITSFRVQATPLSVFNFLAKRNMKLRWQILQCVEDPVEVNEVIKLASKDGSNCITLHEFAFPIRGTEHAEFRYVLQEASTDEFCSFILSSPMTRSGVNNILKSGIPSATLRPSGFSIMPDGSQGLQSDASLVTIALQQDLDEHLETGKAIETMINLISGIVGQIREEVTNEERSNAASS